MKLILQLKQPVIDFAGNPRYQIAGEFDVSGDDTYPIVANTFIGVLVIRREDIFLPVMLADDADLSLLASHIWTIN